MEKQRLDRINELSRVSRERELTDEETAERAALRADYVRAFRESVKQQLENTYVQYPDGSEVRLTEVNKQFKNEGDTNGEQQAKDCE